jgi:hypothetical protein
MPVADRAAVGKLPAESTTFVRRRRLLAEVKAAFVPGGLFEFLLPIWLFTRGFSMKPPSDGGSERR